METDDLPHSTATLEAGGEGGRGGRGREGREREGKPCLSACCLQWLEWRGSIGT